MYNGRRKETMKNQPLAQPVLLGKYDILLKGQLISYNLKRSHIARLIWLDVKRQTGLTVTIPHYYNIKYLQSYLESNASWILRNVSKYCADAPVAVAAAPQSTNTISYLGKSLKVMQNRCGCGLNAIELQQNKLIVSLNSSGTRLSAQELQQWLIVQATRLINEKVKKFSLIMGLAYNRVVIRDQRSRWGSCSCRRNLNFNWRLIMAPEPVLDYVIIHELCHLKEMSHSRSFWDLVALYCPQWHEHRNWLDDHCIELNAEFQL
jgi:predicted metal-dependent hydrolase